MIQVFFIENEAVNPGRTHNSNGDILLISSFRLACSADEILSSPIDFDSVRRINGSLLQRERDSMGECRSVFILAAEILQRQERASGQSDSAGKSP